MSRELWSWLCYLRVGTARGDGVAAATAAAAASGAGAGTGAGVLGRHDVDLNVVGSDAVLIGFGCKEEAIAGWMVFYGRFQGLRVTATHKQVASTRTCLPD